MTNVYGYNRKTLEEDSYIMEAVRKHHEIVESHGFVVVMTSLIGSQNYDLDTKTSDIDTYSLILPSLSDLYKAEPAKAGIIFTKDGHCNYKDVRVALNLLYKTSPNSVEIFTSKYKVYNPIFASILDKYIDDNTKLWDMIHCNYKHMLYAMAGMAHQLTKRNMPPGKCFSHALRLDDMYYHFMNSVNANAIIDMRPGGDRDLALIAKEDTNPDNNEKYLKECKEIAGWLDNIKNNFKLTKEQEETQKRGSELIDNFQSELFKKYLEEVNK